MPPSILAITSELPWPLDSGGHLRTYHLLRALEVFYDVQLVAGTSRQDAEAAGSFSQAGIGLHVAIHPQRSSWKEFGRVVGALVSREPYVMYRRHRHREMALAIRRTASVASYSASYLDHLDSYQYEALCPGVPLVIDLHNVYSTLVHRTGTESRRPYSWYLHREAQLLAQVERRAVNRASLVLAVSDQDAKHFRSLGAKNVCVVPNGVDCQLYERLPIAAANAAPVILFVGAMSWPPNVSAARFLARDAFPAIVKQFPAARLRIIGRDPTPEVLNLARLPGVEVLGRVADMVPHLEHAHILAVPLDAGGGTRLKILEAFAAGIPVVSTAVGLEGIAAEPDREVMVSERATFAETIVELLRDPDRASRMGIAARELARRRYDWSVVGRILCDAVAAVIDRVPAAMYG